MNTSMGSAHRKRADALRCQTRAFIEQVLEDVALEPNLSKALVLGEWLAKYVSINLCGIYRLDKLETCIANRITIAPPQHPPLEQDAELHIASELSNHGGHSRLLRLVASQASGPAHILITRPQAPAAIADILGLDVRHIHVNTDTDPLLKAQSLARFIANYRRVILHIHPEDLSCAVALRLAQRLNPGIRIGLFNHADHCFSVGVGVSHAVFEISTYGWQLRQARGTLDKSSFVGIPINPEAAALTPPSVTTILTAGAGYKYAPVAGTHALPTLLNQLLTRLGDARLTVIGPDKRSPWWRPLLANHAHRVTFIPAIPSAEYTQHLLGCSLYVDSHPLTGGTAFPEALIAGLKVIGLKGGTWGFSYADLLRVASPDEFLDNCVGLLSEDRTLLDMQAGVRQRCQQFHATPAVIKRMHLALEQGTLLAPPGALLALGPPPLLAELNWERAGRSDAPLLNKVQAVQGIHRQITRRHFACFGLFNVASWRLYLTSGIRATRARLRQSSKAEMH